MINRGELAAFLLQAKLHTYAAQGDEASVAPLLPGSRQLEYRDGFWFYRDIYFGGERFVGQETVYYDSTPVWAMSYAGGIIAAGVSAEEILRGYPPLTHQDIHAALAYAAELARERVVALPSEAAP